MEFRDLSIKLNNILSRKNLDQIIIVDTDPKDVLLINHQGEWCHQTQGRTPEKLILLHEQHSEVLAVIRAAAVRLPNFPTSDQVLGEDAAESMASSQESFLLKNANIILRMIISQMEMALAALATPRKTPRQSN